MKKKLVAIIVCALCAAFALCALVGCGGGGDKTSGGAPGTASSAANSASSGAVIVVDNSGKVYDARTTSDKLPEDFRGEMPDGWSIWADITDRNGEECISIDFGAPSGTTYTKPFEDIGYPSGPQLLTLWGANAKNWTESPTFIISIGTDKDSAKTWVMSYVPEKSNMLFWTPDGAELALPGKAYSMDGKATAFDGTELIVGGKKYDLDTDMTILEK